MKIQIARDHQLREIKKLYIASFPLNERKPFGVIKRRIRQGSMEVLRIEKNGFAGLAIMVLYKDYALLDYFAIHQNRRGEGLGSEALQLLQERYKDKKFFLEIEAPDPAAANNIQRLSRKNFYLRNGLQYKNLTVNVYGVIMETLTTGFTLTAKDYLEIYQKGISQMVAKTIKIIHAPVE